MNQPTPTRWLAAAISLLVAASCAQSVGDVVQVQPNVSRKSDLLDGVWYFRNSVTYTPFNTQFTFPGQTGKMEKLVWEIQQGALVGYRAYPYILGAEVNVDANSKVTGTTAKYCDAAGKCVGGQKYYGAPVVSFPIASHFDIQRQYNPATGEQTNVIAENGSDRPWNQREYMRVNWALNNLNRGSGLSWGTVQNPAGGSSSQNWVQPNEPGSDPTDWPAMEYDKDGKLKYMDVTGRYMAMPDTYYFEGFGNVPLCYLTSTPVECGPSEIRMRVSISKVDPVYSRDYEPLLYGNDLMSMFGYFRTERLNYDRRFGFLESARVLLGERHRVWQEYYQKDANGQPDYSKVIPMAQRTPKPVVYYFSRADRLGGQDRYDEFFEPAKATLEPDYNKAFQRAIAAAQHTGSSPLPAAPDLRNVPKMFYLCNNPVKEGDGEACGAVGFSPRFGDLRYSFVNTIAEPVANGLLGYGPSSADPETGMLLSGNSNTYTWGVDLIGRQLTDHIQLLNGDRGLTEYISGKPVKDFIDRNPIYNLRQVKQSAREISSELQSVPPLAQETTGVFDRPSSRIQQILANLELTKNANGAANSRSEMAVAAQVLAENPKLEALLVDNPDMQADLHNLLPAWASERAKRDPEFRRAAARRFLLDVTGSLTYRRQREHELSKSCVMMAEFFDRTMLGLANEELLFVTRELQKSRPQCVVNGEAKKGDGEAGDNCLEFKKPIYDQVARRFRQQIWLATTLHEVGHTINLRHNFQGSFDAVNYDDEYWDLRKDTITVNQGTQKVLPRTPGDLRAAANGTDGQKLGRMHDYESSSIMDYHGKRNGDWTGLGKYDDSAILFAYSGGSEPGYVEVFKSARAESKQFRGSDGTQITISGAAVDLPMVNATATTPQIYNYTERFHYSTVPLHFGEAPDNDIGAIINNGVEKLKMGNRQLAKWSFVRDQEEQIRQSLIADPTLTDTTVAANVSRLAAVTNGKVMRVPYMFCSDESADGPVLSCFRFDRGPDYYEKTRQELEDYWNYYFDTHFRRDRLSFSGNAAYGNAISTFFNIANSYKHWVYRQFRQASRGQEISNNYKVDPFIQDYWTMSVLDGVNQHLSVMAVPEPGLYYLTDPRQAGGQQWFRDFGPPDFDFEELTPQGRQRTEAQLRDDRDAQAFLLVSRGVGRKLFGTFDFRGGYGVERRMLEAGHYNDQVGAMIAAVIPGINIQGVDQDADFNRYSIPYYSVFRNEFQTTFGALWSDDEPKVRPSLFKDRNNAGQALNDQPVLSYRRFVSGNDLFTNFDYPRAQPVACPGMTLRPDCVTNDQQYFPVNINISWTSQIYALFLGMAFFRANYDLDYSKSMQVYKLGSAEAFTPAAGYHTIEIPDVVNGSRYVVMERDGATPDSTPAVRMFTIANAYLTMVRNPGTCPLPAYLAQEGYQCMSAADQSNPAVMEVRRRAWTETFKGQIGMLDMMRDFYKSFGSAF